MNEAGTAPAGPLLRVREVAKAYRRGPETVRALKGVDFELRPGEIVAVVGPSGSGKTTLLNVLAGWEVPDSGEVAWADRPEVTPAERSWRDLAILPQGLGLMEELSVRENVELPLRLLGSLEAHRDRAASLLDLFGLAEHADRIPPELSLGEQQRAAMARALVLEPRLLLADEPTGHQDAGWASVVFQALRDHAEGGTCCLVATHSTEFLRFAGRILSIADGRISERTPERT